MNVDDLGKAPIIESGKPDGEKSGEGKAPDPNAPEFKKAQESAAQLDKLLSDNDCDSVQDLLELVSTGKQVRGLGVKDVDDIKAMQAKARKLDKWEAHYSKESEKARRANEKPEETIARLEREREAERRSRIATEESVEEVGAAKKALENYNKSIGSFVDSQEVGDEMKGFLKKFMGVGHEFAEVDITDKRAVDRMAKKLFKEFKDFEATVIKGYLKSKETAGRVPETKGTGTSTEVKKDGKFKLRDARLALAEQLGKHFQGR